MFVMRRPRFTFWLDLEKPEEEELAYHIVELKKKRSFVKTVRDGIRLIFDLSQGRTEVLQELFPWVLEQAQSPKEGEIGQGSMSAPDGAETAITAQLKRLETLIVEQREKPIERVASGNPNPLTVPQIEAPPFDDMDDLELDIRQAQKDTENISAYNLMISSALNVVGNCNSLPDEVVEYGVRTGRIKPEQAKTVSYIRRKKSG